MAGYRDAFLHCPRCGAALEQAGSAWGCRACRGIWLAEPVLDEMMRTMHAQPIPPRFEPAAPHGGPALACPACPAALTAVWLEGVPVDRCPAHHGVWFDAHELQAALHAAALAADDPDAIAAVPNVRLGVWQQLVAGLTGVLRLVGYGVVGVTAAVVLTPLGPVLDATALAAGTADKLGKKS
jgi:Zn-finger nucleic acid-binding protein